MKTTMWISAGFFAMAIAAAGCDKKQDGPAATATKTAAPVAAAPAGKGVIKGSCNNIKTLGTCTDYEESAFALGEGFIKGVCQGIYSAGPCPTEKALGTCTIDGGQLKKYYPGGTFEYTAADANKDCKELSNGKWTAK